MDVLRTKSGSDFDRAYIHQEIARHVQAIELMETAVKYEDTLPLKQYLIQARPDFLSHLSAAEAVERQLVAQE